MVLKIIDKNSLKRLAIWFTILVLLISLVRDYIKHAETSIAFSILVITLVNAPVFILFFHKRVKNKFNQIFNIGNPRWVLICWLLIILILTVWHFGDFEWYKNNIRINSDKVIFSMIFLSAFFYAPIVLAFLIFFRKTIYSAIINFGRRKYLTADGWVLMFLDTLIFFRLVYDGDGRFSLTGCTGPYCEIGEAMGFAISIIIFIVSSALILSEIKKVD